MFTLTSRSNSVLSAATATSWLWLVLASMASAATPQLAPLNPPGAQRGTTVEVVLSGARLSNPQELIAYYPGITVNSLEPGENNQVKANLTVASDCRLGEHVFRLRTATGVSELQTFYVGPYPSVTDNGKNGDLATPQPIDLNVTINGIIGGDQVDYYQITAKKGERITAVIEAIRLGRVLFDPHISILDSRRFEVAVNDDNALVHQDAITSFVAEEDGEYTVVVRDSAYRAPGNSAYRLHVGTFPQPTAVIPAGGKPGEELEVRFVGDPAGEIIQTVKLPDQADPNFYLFAENALGIAPAGIPFRLNDLENVLEVEPNNANNQTATPVSIGGAANGILSSPEDVDFFMFSGKKDQVVDIHCYARRLRSPLDPVLFVFKPNPGGRQLAGNDDSGGPDSYIRFTIPEDGEYTIRVTDHLRRGGPDFTYRIELTPVQPAVTVGIPRVRQFSQDRQTVVVPRGNRYVTLVSGQRADFGGELLLSAENLPQGVSVSSEPIPDGLPSIPMLFEAAEDAPLSNSMTLLSARHIDENVKIPSMFRQTTDMIYGQNQTVFWNHTVDRLSVAVIEEAPFKLEIVEPKAPLVQNGSMQLKVIAHRKPEFTAPITVEMVFNPPGVTAASSVVIPEGQSEIVYPLNANENASVRKWKIAVSGTVQIDGGALVVSSQLAPLEIAPPFVQFALERATTIQGQPAKVFCKIQQQHPFEGPAQAQLLGLPAKAVAPVAEFSQETAELAFDVTTDATSPAGRHKNIVCQVTLTINGEPVVHNVGMTELRIDPPPPPKADAPVEAVAATPPPQEAAPAEKPLSRLQQLRLEAQQNPGKGN